MVLEKCHDFESFEPLPITPERENVTISFSKLDSSKDLEN